MIRNPTKSRPLSANVKRLMKASRLSPLNPDVVTCERTVTEHDIAFCDQQGSIFMAAVDRGITMAEFAPLYMDSQIAGIMDYSFSRSGREFADVMNIPLLLKSPELIVDTLVWLQKAIGEMDSTETLESRIMMSDGPQNLPNNSLPEDADPVKLADLYEYAYFLGFIYRYECLLHDESSRMVFGAFPEEMVRRMYDGLLEAGVLQNTALVGSAEEICRRLDMLLVGQKEEER